MNLVISLRQPIERRYGLDGYSAIREALADYAASSLEGATTVFVDDPADVEPFGIPGVPGTPQDILAAIRRLRELLSSVDTVLLVGSDAIVPVWQFDNPIVDRRADPDRFVLTDNPYGTRFDAFDEYLAPDLPVGRLVEPPGRNANDFVRLIGAASRNRRRTDVRPGSVAIFNAEWEQPAREVMSVLMPVVDEHQAPGYQLTSANGSDLQRGYLYFNLHGFPDDPAWKAFDPVRGTFATVITPQALETVDLSGAVVFAENCYGALLPPGRASCAGRMMQLGAGAFVGATGLSFGSHIRPDLMLDHADFLARHFLAHAVSGARVGDALVTARRAYVEDPAVHLSNPFKQKTLLQYRLLGDPSLN